MATPERVIVTPYVGVWIETSIGLPNWSTLIVTPYVGVWIETERQPRSTSYQRSLLMWECGLKLCYLQRYASVQKVTPYVGVWIETTNYLVLSSHCQVTPYVGVWIETAGHGLNLQKGGVTPYVGVWIETTHDCIDKGRISVTPYVGVWIETYTRQHNLCTRLSLLMWECGLKRKEVGKTSNAKYSHSLCGSVD